MPDPITPHAETTAPAVASADEMPPDVAYDTRTATAVARPPRPAATAVAERPEVEPAVEHSEEENLTRLRDLYYHAGDLEIAFSRVVERDPGALMTEEQALLFNDYLKGAREFLPTSIALRDDIEEAYLDRSLREAHRDLRITLVPSLHNALQARGISAP